MNSLLNEEADLDLRRVVRTKIYAPSDLYCSRELLMGSVCRYTSTGEHTATASAHDLHPCGSGTVVSDTRLVENDS